MKETIEKLIYKREKIKTDLRSYQLTMSELFDFIVEYIDSLLEKDNNTYERSDITAKSDRTIEYRIDDIALVLKYYLISDYIDFDVAKFSLKFWEGSRMYGSCNFKDIENEKQLKRNILIVVRKFRKAVKK